MMKKAILFACTALLCGGAAMGGLISDDPGELNVSGQYWYPDAGYFTLCDAGYGLSATYREWFRFPWGVSLNLGAAQWQVAKNSNAYKYDKYVNYKGDVFLIPLGASLCFSLIDWDNWNLVLETGPQYVFVDSNATLFNKEDGANRTEDVKLDNAVLWTVGADFEYMVSENFYVLAGLGYQVDVMDSDTTINGKTTRGTSFEGSYGRLGVKYLF